ncbi:putative bifunctional diguanylate cyclase/phosphodiesterase [Bacillus piscicola]|uniref:putative bifunctional diguanylate cyclase/phosphodiesterase n=1 Tax=Bacillus piscicola TaxID=1632684 RepID=UPI001F0894A3
MQVQQKQKRSNRFLTKKSVTLIFPLLLVFFIFYLNESLYGSIGEENFPTAHLLISFFIVIVSASIALQAWMVFPYSLSNLRIGLGALFFAVSLLEIGHAVSYEGMPFFFTESSAYQATWFYIISRLLLAFGLLFIVLTKERKVPLRRRWSLYGTALLGAVVSIIVLYVTDPLLPNLVIEGQGTTALKNNLQITALAVQLVVAAVIFFKRKTGNPFYAMILLASLYLICGDVMYMSYSSVHGLRNFTGHIYQVVSVFFLMRALYYTAVQEPFQMLRQTEEKQQKGKAIIEYMAYYDELTALPNKRYFKEQVQEAIECGENDRMAVLLLDIDRFKNINESLGYPFGDKLLAALTTRLRQALAPEIVLARFNGDEFALLIAPVTTEEEVKATCLHIKEQIEAPLQVQHLQLKVTVNIGTSLYPEHGQDEEELLKNASVAMFKAQEQKSGYLFYDASMAEELEDRLLLENDLYLALPRDELFLLYQPQVRTDTMDIIAFEALLRWEHPERGLVSPGEFIPIAEQNGLIIPIGEWVLDTACGQLKKWHDDGFPHLRMSVNLSTRQIYQDDFLDMVADVLRKHDLAASSLVLEITESMLMTNMEHSLVILQELKKIGVQIAVDDFGTGYSSLSYLKHLPFDCLKIDQTFIRDFVTDQETAALVSMIISIAQHLQMDVIAEGVEDITHFQFLQDMNCWHVQGYLFSKPLPPEKWTDFFMTNAKEHWRNLPKQTEKDSSTAIT